MPVYNSQETVYCSIKSVLNQTYDNFEFIIVNDGSTDNSEDIILSFNDERIRYLKIDHKGRSYASNYGISKASSNYLARLDADDLYLKDKLNRQMTFLAEHPEIDILYCWSIFYNESNLLRFWKSPEYDIDIKDKLMYLNPINHSSVIFKKETITKLSGYKKDVEINEDYDLWIRCSNDSVFFCLQEYLVFSKLWDNTNKKKYDKDLVLLLKDNINSKTLSGSKISNDSFGRVECYYGSINEARKYLLKGNLTKNLFLIFYTFIPDIALNKIRGKRISLLFTLNIFKIIRYKRTLTKLLRK